MCCDHAALENGETPAVIEAQAETCSWRAVGASVPGVSHIKADLPCQDAQAHRSVPAFGSQVLLVAVADGAGSAESSERGALLAVEAAMLSLESALAGTDAGQPDYESLLRMAFESARQALFELAELEEIPVRSLATTLTCCIAGDGWLAVGQLGDGAVVVQNAQGELLSVTVPQRGEYANETNFLVQDNALDEVQVQIIEDHLQALAVMSDGLMRLALKMPANAPHPPFFLPLFAFTTGVEDTQAAQEQLAAFLTSERVNARTDDDKSIVLAVCNPSGAIMDDSGEPAIS